MPTQRRRDSNLRRLWRHYTGDLHRQDLQRLFDRDAARVWRVLTRDEAKPKAARTSLGRGWIRLKLVLIGLSTKLSPPRRLLFGVALVTFVLGLGSRQLELSFNHVVIRFPSLYLVVAFALMVFLLALELADRVLVRDELEVARELQRDLLPHAVPELPGFRFAHASRTANEVGGDYHDYIPLADGRLALVIGDASGHGMASGLLMAIASAVLKLALELDPAPEKVFSLVNRVLCRTGDRRAFMSLFVGILDPSTGALTYACAGHPFPLLRRSGGAIEELGQGGLPLGLRLDRTVAADATVLQPDDALLLYSDGLPEAASPRGEPLGFECLERGLRPDGDPPSVVARLLAALDAHADTEPLHDDLSLVVVQRLAASPELGLESRA
ncbi:MAG: PP2C family protein-serine/threonine phosphatase [Thermoanaerobaculaceae bacterium]|nr:PP2C family protein-serine/threonine phosphatase [Thermoanaerobaculaceae bacterium]MDI9623055.1 PP2C family protein-serine/threonine phosphatase [Acidobacteriota bacterium]HPW55370.1 PP2C family protein-serine/threonine phosphatase [Thermoanaerobaculaceae bacterium]